MLNSITTPCISFYPRTAIPHPQQLWLKEGPPGWGFRMSGAAAGWEKHFPQALLVSPAREGRSAPLTWKHLEAALSLHSPLAQHPPHPTHHNLACTCLVLFHLHPPCVLGSFSSFHTGEKKGQNKVSPTAAGWVPGCQLGPDSALVRAGTGASTPVFPSELGAGLHKQRPWGTGEPLPSTVLKRPPQLRKCCDHFKGY